MSTIATAWYDNRGFVFIMTFRKELVNSLFVLLCHWLRQFHWRQTFFSLRQIFFDSFFSVSFYFSSWKVTVTAWHIAKQHQHKGISFLWFCFVRVCSFRILEGFDLPFIRFRNCWNTFPIIYCINKTDGGCNGNLLFSAENVNIKI